MKLVDVVVVVVVVVAEYANYVGCFVFAVTHGQLMFQFNQ